MAVLGPSEARRLTICDWLTANGINPNAVPLHSNLHVDTKPNGDRVICYQVFVTEEGRPVAAYSSKAIRVDREAPLVVEPPETWPA